MKKIREKIIVKKGQMKQLMRVICLEMDCDKIVLEVAMGGKRQSNEERVERES